MVPVLATMSLGLLRPMQFPLATRLLCGNAIVIEALLSFPELGMPPRTPSRGEMFSAADCQALG
jgi:ABC-type dipeptide/oligopeptide/nickel transport system permease subunit